MGLIGFKLAGPGTAESGLGKERSGELLSREAEKARGTASYDDAVKAASKNLQTVFKGDTKIAGQKSGNTHVDTL